MSESAFTIHIDGAARGNPGPAAFAFVIKRPGMPTVEDKGCLGKLTNNVAEYTALVKALEKAAELGGLRLHIYSDSELLVKQMKGIYKVKNPDLLRLSSHARDLVERFEQVRFEHVPRERNAHADHLCNQALDGPAARPASKPKPAKASNARSESVREEAVLCLRAAAAAWARGNPNDPQPEQVWDQLWSMLEDQGVLRPSRGN